jgi:hypothetical protein
MNREAERETIEMNFHFTFLLFFECAAATLNDFTATDPSTARLCHFMDENMVSLLCATYVRR